MDCHSQNLKMICDTDNFHNVESTLWYYPQYGKYNLNLLNCRNHNVDFCTTLKDWLKISHKTLHRKNHFPQCEKEVKSTLIRLPQLNRLTNFLEEILKVCTIWTIHCHIFHNVESMILIFHIAEITM